MKELGFDTNEYIKDKNEDFKSIKRLLIDGFEYEVQFSDLKKVPQNSMSI